MDYAITLTGTNWPLPLNPKIVFALPPPPPVLVIPHVINDSFANARNLGNTSTRVTANTLALAYGGDVAYFAVTTGKAGVYQATANGANVQIFDGLGRLVTQGRNAAAVRVTRAGVRRGLVNTLGGIAATIAMMKMKDHMSGE